MAEIELINVSKSWGNFNAVIDFNLNIKDKEFLDEKYQEYNNVNFIEQEPIQITHLYTEKKDIEIQEDEKITAEKAAAAKAAEDALVVESPF